MKNLSELSTPAFLIDLSVTEDNIMQMADLCKKSGKQLYPMVKTHKCSYIADMQRKYGVDGFLVGTIDEAELLIDNGHDNIVFAYPVMCRANLERIINLARKVKITLAIDGVDSAKRADEMIAAGGLSSVDYLMIIDCGLHRFGVEPNSAAHLAEQIACFKHLVFKGISTHPGHVYGKTNLDGVKEVATIEDQELALAKSNLEDKGFKVAMVATGSTPTVFFTADSDVITALRPGNYTFYDSIQVALSVAKEEQCAFTVLASIVSNPKDGLFIIDAGSKCLGLDTGAHGVSLLQGYGMVKGHPELVVEGLSEEVGKVKIKGNTGLKVGDKIQIIPNHSCASANMTSYVYGLRDGNIEKIIEIDARGNSKCAQL